MLPRQAVADPPEWIATRASSRSTRDADVEAEDEQWPEEDREEGGQDPRERPERVEVVLDEGHDQPDHSVEQARDLERHQKSWVSPPKMADTESSAKTFMIVSASRPATGRTVMLSGRVSGSIGSVSVTTIPATSALPRRSNPSALSCAWVTKIQTSLAPRSLSACAPAISVFPVVVTSSPTIAILSRTRPVISVTGTASCAARVLCITANSASSISAKRTATRARPASGATETTPSPMKPRSRKWRPKSGSAVMWSTGTVKNPWI